MGVSNLPVISENLIARGASPDRPAAVIHWGTTPRHKVVAGTLRTLPGLAAAAGLKPPAIIVVGEVVALRDRLQWFERRPLLGRRIIVTRSRAQASELASQLEALGAETIEAPAIRIEPPDDDAPLREAARNPAAFDWIVFTSVNGVDAFFAALAAEGQDARALAGRKVAAVGPATAERLARSGIRADLQPDIFTGAAVAAAMAARQDLAGVRILLPRTDIAPRELADALAARGAHLREVVAYRTVPDVSGARAAAEAIDRGEADWITFTSSSTVTNFLDAVGADRVRASHARMASIGPTTSATLREAGLAPTVEAEPHTIPGLVEGIVKHDGRSR
jgi:uroporphyrinogen III methyltransferase/synthase